MQSTLKMFYKIEIPVSGPNTEDCPKTRYIPDFVGYHRFDARKPLEAVADCGMAIELLRCRTVACPSRVLNVTGAKSRGPPFHGHGGAL